MALVKLTLELERYKSNIKVYLLYCMNDKNQISLAHINNNKKEEKGKAERTKHMHDSFGFIERSEFENCV